MNMQLHSKNSCKALSMMPKKLVVYDLIVLGGGLAGVGAAIAVASKNNTDTKNVDIDKVHKIMEKQDLIYK